MGSLTRAQLIQEGGLAAGNDKAYSFVRVWLNAWLQRTAKSWSWPVLKYDLEAIAVNSGVKSVQVGNGSSQQIHRIFNPLFIYTADYSVRGRVFIRSRVSSDIDIDNVATDSTKRTGTPTTVQARANSDANLPGVWDLFLDPIPNKAYLLKLTCHIIPANLSLTAANDTLIPWYPNDRTLIQAVKCGLMELNSRGEGNQAYDNEMMKLAAMVVDDRDFDGEGPGDNVLMGLDPSVFL